MSARQLNLTMRNNLIPRPPQFFVLRFASSIINGSRERNNQCTPWKGFLQNECDLPGLKYPIEQCHNFIITTPEVRIDTPLFALSSVDKISIFLMSQLACQLMKRVPCISGYLISSLRTKIKRINASLVLSTCVMAQSVDHQNCTPLFCHRTQCFSLKPTSPPLQLLQLHTRTG